MGKSVGIDLGTTNSVVAVMEGGKPTVIANAEGGRTTPSVVAFSKNGERLVGQLARRQAVLNPTNTVYSIKRFMGRRFEEVDNERRLVSYRAISGPDGGCKVSLQGRDYSPEEISAMILRKLKEDAEKYLGEKVTSAVITVPAYFNDAQRQATKNAGAIAGLEVLRIINEPTAAALAYGMEKDKTQHTIMVFDLGGGTFDVSVLEVGDGLYEVKSTSGDTHLGGDDFDRCIVDYLAEEFKKQEGIDLRSDVQALQRLTEASEKAKVELSSMTDTSVSLPFVTANASGPKHLDIKLNRSKFNELTHDLVERCRGPVEQALRDAKIKANEIDEVVLVGGSTRIPAVQELVKSLAGGKEPNQSVNPDEVVAIGAAIQAGVLAGEVKNVVLLDVTPLSLGLETMGGVFTKLVERNTTVPTHKAQVFSTAEDMQSAVDVCVFQGERPMARDNKLLGDFRLEGIAAATRGTPQIEVAFDIDANGILNVTAKDLSTGKEQKITITASTNLTKEDVERMVKEAESHAKDDQELRERADVRNEADSTVYSIERQLSELRQKAPSVNASALQLSLDELRAKLKGNADTAQLKNLISEIKGQVQDLERQMAQAAQEAPQQPYAQAGARTGNNGGNGGAHGNSGSDIIDAEVTSSN